MTVSIARAALSLPRILVAAAALACSLSAVAVDPQRQLSQYGHSAWRTQDGHLPGMPMALAQGPDGYLWIGTLNGLVRFDGVRFGEWSAPEGANLHSDAITRLLATPDGELWIGTQQGLGRWNGVRLENFPSTPGGAIMSITQDRDRAIWITRNPRTDSSELVCRVALAGEFDCFGEADGLRLPESPCCPAAFFVDTEGVAWIGSDKSLTTWARNTSTVFRLPLDLPKSDMGVTAIVAREGGGYWVGVAKTGPGLGLQQFVDGKFLAFAKPGFDGSALPVSSMLRDRQGALWIGTYGQGLVRIHGDDVDRFDVTDGLTADKINGLFEDREGNLWVATSKGLDQFRDLRVASFAKRQGLASDSAASIAAARDGAIWIGTAGLDVLRDGKISHVSAFLGLPDGQVTDILEDHAGRMWVGVDRTLWIIDKGKSVAVRTPSGTTDVGYLRSLAEDARHDVWGLSGKSLLRIRDGAVVEEIPITPALEGRQVIADPQSGVWLGLKTGGLARLREGEVDIFEAPVSPGASVNAFVAHMAITPSGAVLGATANGIVGSKDGRTQLLTIANGLPCRRAHALVHDRQGNLWAYLQCGLVQIPAAEMLRWWGNPHVRLQLRQFDGLDGVDPGWAPFRGATVAADGNLWFANGNGVQTIDPTATTRNRTAPPVHIESLVADRVDYLLESGLQLPPLVRDLRIDYTANSFVIPQRVAFRYRLMGRDTAWQEPGGRRQAFYTDLPPGDYRFVVIARNDDGLWNEQGDSTSFVILPAWYQTLLFRFSALLLGLLVAWLLYRWRMRRLAATLTARFDERLAERLRIARELHDTLLQTVQAGKLVADDALDPAVDEDRRRHALQRISAWLGEASAEGRAALNALRQSTALGNDLAEALQQNAEEFAGHSGMTVHVAVVGRTREMHPIVRDEIYRIGSEAIRNAASHSQGESLDIELAYGSDFSVRVKDDGVGMDAVDVEHGKPDHFGLQGMRERAQRIGGRLTIARLPAGGTEVRLIVPGQSAFRHPGRRDL